MLKRIGDDYLAYALEAAKFPDAKPRYRRMAFLSRHKGYLRTPRWRALRKLALDLAGHECSKCRHGGRLEVHHWTYDRWGHELLSDLKVLCHACHLKTHGREKWEDAT